MIVVTFIEINIDYLFIMTFDFTMIFLLVCKQPTISKPVLDEVRILRTLDHVSSIHYIPNVF